VKKKKSAARALKKTACEKKRNGGTTCKRKKKNGGNEKKTACEKKRNGGTTCKRKKNGLRKKKKRRNDLQEKKKRKRVEKKRNGGTTCKRKKNGLRKKKKRRNGLQVVRRKNRQVLLRAQAPPPAHTKLASSQMSNSVDIVSFTDLTANLQLHTPIPSPVPTPDDASPHSISDDQLGRDINIIQALAREFRHITFVFGAVGDVIAPPNVYTMNLTKILTEAATFDPPRTSALSREICSRHGSRKRSRP
jgi:hypothetical protein